jgi:hypothetical protein
MAALLALGAGCAQASVEEDGATTTAAVVDSKPAALHSAVGSLVDGDVSKCTGTLIASDIVLTAAHCFADTTKLDFLIGSKVYAAKASGDAEHPWAHVHPRFADGKHDLAYVVLAKPVPASVVRPARIGSHANADDCAFDVVGHDLAHGANVCVTAARAGVLTGMNADGAGCVGESGGSLLLRGASTDVIVGIGGDTCEGDEMSFIALASETSFVREALAAGKRQVAFD